MLASPLVTPREAALESPELQARWRELRETGELAAELAGDLTERQLWWRPSPERWSVGECLDHLVKTGEEYLVVLDEATAKGRAAGRTGTGPFRRTFLGRWIAGTLEPPPGSRFPAPKVIRPRRPAEPASEAGEADGESPLPAFLELRSRLRERLEAADGLHLGRVRVWSPFIPLLSVDLDSAFALVAVHERRHLWQARQVREHPEFPKAA